MCLSYFTNGSESWMRGEAMSQNAAAGLKDKERLDECKAKRGGAFWWLGPVDWVEGQGRPSGVWVVLEAGDCVSEGDEVSVGGEDKKFALSVALVYGAVDVADGEGIEPGL